MGLVGKGKTHNFIESKGKKKQAQEGNSRVRLEMTNKRSPPPRPRDMY